VEIAWIVFFIFIISGSQYVLNNQFANNIDKKKYSESIISDQETYGLKRQTCVKTA